MLLLLFISILVFSDAALKKAYDGVLSDEEHYGNDDQHEHNTQYDHDAFLGKDAASGYSELTPEESKKKLGKLFHKVDEDGDGQVTEAELQDWMHNSQNRYAKQDAAENIKRNDLNSDGQVTWDEYKKSTYGFLDKNGVPKDNVDPDKYNKYSQEHNKEYYAKQIVRDERRYKMADTDVDGTLNQDELSAFLHPETHDHMKGVAALETIEDMDNDKDGLVSLEEYLADMLPPAEQGKEEPSWFKEEKQNFTASYDKDKDGKMDVHEVKNWLFPPEDDYLKSEAKHLISESDTDGDGKISKQEMVDKHETFVGSQATEFGELLQHDEL